MSKFVVFVMFEDVMCCWQRIRQC